MRGKALFAEFIGTFALVFVGAGAVAVSAQAGTGLLGVALAHGLTIAVMVSATAAISGGHLNPAVTIGLWSAGKFDGRSVPGYLAAQLAAAVLAVLALLLIIPQEMAAVRMAAPALGADVSGGGALLTEAILTFFLLFVICGTVIDRRAPSVGGLYVGLTLTLAILMAGPISGGALNPARHFGPALFAGTADLGRSWVYWLGAVLGGVAAAQAYRLAFAERRDVRVVHGEEPAPSGAASGVDGAAV